MKLFHVFYANGLRESMIDTFKAIKIHEFGGKGVIVDVVTYSRVAQIAHLPDVQEADRRMEIFSGDVMDGTDALRMFSRKSWKIHFGTK